MADSIVNQDRWAEFTVATNRALQHGGCGGSLVPSDHGGGLACARCGRDIADPREIAKHQAPDVPRVREGYGLIARTEAWS